MEQQLEMAITTTTACALAQQSVLTEQLVVEGRQAFDACFCAKIEMKCKAISSKTNLPTSLT